MSEIEKITPSRQALAEALTLSSEILKNLELSELPLTNIALKTSRLARLLNEVDYQKIMELEAGGYPSLGNHVSQEIWNLGKMAGRTLWHIDNKTKEQTEYIYLESIGQLEESLKVSELALTAARDPDISSANSSVSWNRGFNRVERTAIRELIDRLSNRLSQRRSFIHQYASRKYYELQFSGIADDIFARTRIRVDAKIGELIPDAIQKLTAVYESLTSENPENWANAVHSCRRILQDLADVLFPPTDEVNLKMVDGKEKKIKLGKDNYINRIIAYVETRSNSERFQEIVGSELSYLGERLDSIFQATQKGSHSTVSKEEADRYVVYTYLLVGDILSLHEQ